MKARSREFILRGSFLCRYDEHSHERFPPGDPSKRAFTYFVLTGGRFIYASALRLAVLKFILSMSVGAAVAHPIFTASSFAVVHSVLNRCMQD